MSGLLKLHCKSDPLQAVFPGWANSAQINKSQAPNSKYNLPVFLWPIKNSQWFMNTR